MAHEITEVWHGWKCDACGTTWELDFKPDAHTIFDPFQGDEHVPVQCPGNVEPSTMVTVRALDNEPITHIEMPPHPADA